MNQLIQKVLSLPQLIQEQSKIAQAKKTALQLYKSGRIEESELEAILGGFGNITINIQTLDQRVNHTENNVENTGTLWNYQGNEVIDERIACDITRKSLSNSVLR